MWEIFPARLFCALYIENAEPPHGQRPCISEKRVRVLTGKEVIKMSEVSSVTIPDTYIITYFCPVSVPKLSGSSTGKYRFNLVQQDPESVL